MLDITSVDNLVIKLDSALVPLICVLLYRPLQNMPLFPQILGEQMAHLIINHAKTLLIGDFNYWANDVTGGLHSTELTDLLNGLNCIQHVTSPTHIEGHTLDQIWTSKLTVFAFTVSLCTWSDHFLIKLVINNITTFKPPAKEGIMGRKWNHIDINAFCSSLANTVPIGQPSVNLSERKHHSLVNSS